MATDSIVRRLDRARKLEMRNESRHLLEGAAPSVAYSREYRFQAEHCGREYLPSSCHGLIYSEADSQASLLFYAVGGASAVHPRSLCVIEEQCFAAVGPYVVCLSLPNLELRWSTKVDSATCFGIHLLADRQGLISHGELEVARVALSGEIVWAAGGADIFSEGLSVSDAHVTVTDFNQDEYVFDIETGHVLASTVGS